MGSGDHFTERGPWIATPRIEGDKQSMAIAHDFPPQPKLIIDGLEPARRKEYPITTGCLDYFPDAIAEVAHCSWVATQQHHPGQPMHWERNKSSDHADCAGRHLAARGTVDGDGIRHTAKLAWRALALLQLELEAERARGN